MIAIDPATIPLGDLGLSARPHNCLRRAGVTSLAELLHLSDDELLAIPNFGMNSLTEVRQCIGEFNPRWRGAEAPSPLVLRTESLIGGLIQQLAADAIRTGRAVTLGDLFRSWPSEEWLTWESADAAAALDGIDLRSVLDDMIPVESWGSSLRHAFGVLDQRDKEILLAFAPGLRKEDTTLESVSQRYGLTRERIRQLLAGSREKLLSSRGVADALEHLCSYLVPGCTITTLRRAGFDPGSQETQLLAGLAAANGTVPGRFNFDPIQLNDTLWYLTDFNFKRQLDELAVELDGAVLAVDELRHSWRLRLSALAADPIEIDTAFDCLVLNDNRFMFLGDRAACSASRSMLGRSIAALRLTGEPLTLDELVAFTGGQTPNLRNQLASPEGRELVALTRDRTYALHSWEGIEAMPSTMDLMLRTLREFGPMEIHKLAEQISTLTRCKPKSVETYARTYGEFVVERGMVRLRQADEPVASPGIGESSSLLRLVEGPLRGCPAVRIRVDYQRQYHSSTPAPVSLAGVLGLAHGERHELTVENLPGRTIPVRWAAGKVSLFSRNGLRPACEHLGASDGDLLRLVVTGHHRVVALVEPPIAEDLDGAQWITRWLGSSNTNDLVGQVAFAVGLDGLLGREFSASDLLARLTERGDKTLMARLLSTFPGLHQEAGQ